MKGPDRPDELVLPVGMNEIAPLPSERDDQHQSGKNEIRSISNARQCRAIAAPIAHYEIGAKHAPVSHGAAELQKHANDDQHRNDFIDAGNRRIEQESHADVRTYQRHHEDDGGRCDCGKYESKRTIACSQQAARRSAGYDRFYLFVRHEMASRPLGRLIRHGGQF